MGAGQSSGRQAGSAPEVKTSYYELLGVERTATDDELKKAYRRKALELHPDRNYGDSERTTALFASIQAAYEVLSDPQERAWYDAHEDAILRDIDPQAASADGSGASYETSVGLTSADDLARLLTRFNRATTPFTDAPTGFFGFLRGTFEQLAAEEVRAARSLGVAAPDYPSFGHAADGHVDVARPFYGVWVGFSTLKTFAWRDRYRKTDARDRWERRAMDKENRRMRSEGVREFNDAVRSLVAFVRKRDPRVEISSGGEEEREKVLREAARAQAERQRRENNKRLDEEVLPAWVTQSAKPGDDALEGTLEESEESEDEQIECVACRKTFKSEKQFEAHERSKKHLKQVASLKRRMKKEGAMFDIDNDDNDDDTEEGFDNIENATPVDSQDTVDDEDIAKPDTIPTPASQPQPQQAAPSTDEDNQAQSSDPSDASQTDSTDDADADADTDLTSATQNLHLNGDEASTSDNKSRSPQSRSQTTAPKMGKAAQKRAKKAAAAASSDIGNSASAEHRCARCGAAFGSKTKLFAHVREAGHAAPVAVTGAGGKKGKKR